MQNFNDGRLMPGFNGGNSAPSYISVCLERDESLVYNSYMSVYVLRRMRVLYIIGVFLAPSYISICLERNESLVYN